MPAIPASILVIHDSFPLITRSGADSRLMQILRALREEGHFVTYIARTALGRDECADALDETGIRVFANDAERLRWTGKDLPSEWNFEELLSEGKFDLAILSQ